MLNSDFFSHNVGLVQLRTEVHFSHVALILFSRKEKHEQSEIKKKKKGGPNEEEGQAERSREQKSLLGKQEL